MYRAQLVTDSPLAVVTYAGVEGPTRSYYLAKVFESNREAVLFMTEKYPNQKYKLLPVE